MKHLAVLAIAVLLLTLFLLPARGSDYYSYGNTGGYCAPRKVVVAETVFVPTPIPFALFQFISPPTTPPPVTLSAAYAQAQQQQATQVAGRQATADNDRLVRIEAALARLAGQQATPVVANGPPPVRTEGPPVAGATAARTNIGQVAALLSARCSQCHTAPGRGDVSLFNAQGAFGPSVSRAEIYASVRNDRMPRNPQKLAPEEKALLQAWAAEAP